MSEIFLGVLGLTMLVLILSLSVIGARKLLVPSGSCSINVNDRLNIDAPVGQHLLNVLTSAGINLPGACGGAGTCGLCKARLPEEAEGLRPQERALLSRAEIAQGTRLACQVPILHPLRVVLEDNCFEVSTWKCRVESSINVTSLIRELVLNLPAEQKLNFWPGSFVQITCPPYQLDFSTLDIATTFRSTWDHANLRSLKAGTSTPVVRAYSMANRPSDQTVIRLNIRIALPPPGRTDIPPGIVSSWLFSLKPGDEVEVAGCFGDFQVEPNDREAIFIGGGVGMAPLYAQITDLLDHQHSNRRISFWYGARSQQELYYVDDLERLANDHQNFSWHVALSMPNDKSNWQGPMGFIHKVILEQYLGQHETPEDCDYYLCGPPLMIKAVFAMLDSLGVEANQIYYDDFGGG